MNVHEQMVSEYLILGAMMNKVVEIEYEYLDNKSRRIGGIQPIKWLVGRKGTHILTWDIDQKNWRRFAVKNIKNVTLTQQDWVNQDIRQQLVGGSH